MSRSGDLIVAGGGIFGLASALALAERGLSVTLFDVAASSPNASAVAAGMLAPVGEAVFDPAAARHYRIMAEALDLWPDFAQRHGLTITTKGLQVLGDHEGALQATGVTFGTTGSGAFVASEALVIDPAASLQRLKTRLSELGGRIESRSCAPEDYALARTAVVATGSGGGPAPELAHLTPVKGQLVVLPHGPVDGPVIRWEGGYLAPQPRGARLGATMEIGVGDDHVDAAASSRLIAGGLAQVPGLDVRGAYGEAAVRMQTPDGLPLVGPSALPNTLLATGARRNGWLFAPLVGAMIAAYCMGDEPGPWADALHPGRFVKKT